MSAQFRILDVSAEFLMDIAKIVSSSPHPLSKEDILASFRKNKRYVANGLSQCLQLGLVVLQDRLYVGSEKHGDLIKRSDRPQLYIPFRDALQKYSPFLLYSDFISKSYSSNETAAIVKGILRIQISETIIEQSLRRWGKYAKLIMEDSEGNLHIPEAKKGLPSKYIQSLLKALQAELRASIFLIETMGQQAYMYLSKKGIGIEELANALVNYEKKPKLSATRACQTFEHFLFKFGEDVGVDVSRYSGIIELANAIRGQRVMLRNQCHICHGIGGLRNMAHHDPDKETGKVWNFTPQGAIISILAVPTMIRSLYLFWKEKKQEV